MLKLFYIRFCFAAAILSFVAVAARGQTATMTTTGNWNTATNWSGSNIGDALAETIIINNSVSPTIPNGNSYTVGNLTLNQDNNFTIDASGVLSVGSSGNARNFTTNLNANLVVVGNLEIWGDLIANNNITFNITGTIHIHGNLILSGAGTNATVNGAGNLIIGGNMTGGANVNFTVNGAVSVAGNVNVGGGSNLNGTGTFSVGGTCTGAPFCSSGILPVELLYFKAQPGFASVSINWATASEKDVDYFTIGRSTDGLTFTEIGRIRSKGNSSSQQDYAAIDEKPSLGNTYFRLNEIDLDGKVTILETIRAEFTGRKNVNVYPNPSVRGEDLTIALNFVPHGSHEVVVFDLTGKRIGSVEIMNGQVTLPFILETGVYVMRIASSDYHTVQRVVVR